MAKVIKARTTAAGVRVVDIHRDTVAPAVTDDSNKDNAVGTTWELVDANGLLLKTYICTSAAVGAATWGLLSEKEVGYQVNFFEEVVVLTGAASNNLVNQLPANAIPLFAVCNYDVAVVLATAVKIGLGTAASIVGFGKTGTTVTKNAKNTLGGGALINVPVAAATTLQLASVDTSGVAAGTGTSGSVRVRVFYMLPDQLPDA